ncbi:hypothetical protein INT44_005048 [Umbelopsis vinacea]|uniref:Lysosomal dipeptide transporter MFSD1 n=1 Tax=Umbelopsis vinacea TaxID=44442 RepID=A0A8H7Q7B3_9FUNG|nr:hypothetical protein INT44_005048 [Umbelopsis vinacea]
MPDPHATERTPLLSHSSQQYNVQYDLNYSNEPITHVIPNQSGTPTYISTQQSKQCCSGRENCSLACQTSSASTNSCCRSGDNFTVNVPNDQNECCGLGLGCSIKGDVKTCCRASSSKAEIERNESTCDGLSSQPWQNKAVALLCALLLAVGSHFAAHTLGAMKNIIKEEFGISNSQYGVIQSSVSIVNTILPVLGGLFIDAFGTATGSFVTTLLITSGNVLVAYSTHNRSLMTMILGRVLYGIGSGTVVIVQETILSHWFSGRSLAGVVSLMLTTSRLASFAAQASMIPIAEWTGWYGYALWFSAALCFFSMLVNMIYIMLLRHLEKKNVTDKACAKFHIDNIKQKKDFSWNKLLHLPHSYWLIAVMEFLLGGGWGCFLHINSEFVKFRFGYNNYDSARIASTAQIAPIIVMPFLGLFINRNGKRTWMMIASGASMLLSMVLLGYTMLPPVIGMLIFSLSLALGPVALVSSVPVILPLCLVGTGMGIIKSGTNIGATIFDIVVGRLQDSDPQKGYDSVLIFFMGISVAAVIAGIVLAIIDRVFYSGILDANARQSKLLVGRDSRGELKVPRVEEKVVLNWVYGSIFVALAVASWVLFFIFVLK